MSETWYLCSMHKYSQKYKVSIFFSLLVFELYMFKNTKKVAFCFVFKSSKACNSKTICPIKLKLAPFSSELQGL